MKKLLLFLFFLSPSIIFAYEDLDVSISDAGVISGFSVSCQNASSTDATALLLRTPEDGLSNPFVKSVYAYMRRPCINGTAYFNSFDLNTYLVNNAGEYPSWLSYFENNFNLVVKDTTGLYAPDAPFYNQIINLVGGHNGYDSNVLRIENDTYKTLGAGTSYSFDEVNSWWDFVSTSKKAPPKNSSVLFLPGLEASRLYFDKPDCIIVNCTDQLWEPNGNSDVEDLYLDENGKSIRSGVYTKDIIDESNTPISLGFAGLNIYKSFINMMDDMVKDREIRQWKPFPYDWREDVFDIVKNGVETKDGKVYLIQTLEDMVSKSRSGKVTIVSHSNGGLLAKALLYKLQELKDQGQSNLIDRIDKIVFVAVPHIGTPSTISAMLHGYDQSFVMGQLMDEKHARELGKNMRSAYGLLPSLKYMEKVSTPPIVFDNSIDFDITKKYIEKYGNSINSFSELNSFLFGDSFVPEPTFNNTLTPIKLNQNMLAVKDTFHDKLDNFIFPNSIKIINFSGWGLNTIASFKYIAKKNCPTDREVTCINGYFLNQKPVLTVDGDKTVVSESAMYTDGEKWWVNLENYNKFRFSKLARDHSNILEVSDLLTVLGSVFKNENPTENDVITKTKPIDTENRMQLSVHSPVDIGVYDKLGNFTGKVCKAGYDFCYKQEDIPNSSYLEFGEGKYIDIKESEYQKTTLEGYGIGTFNFEISKKFPDGTSTTTAFYDIPVTPQTKAEIVYDLKSNPILKIDTDGNGTFDIEIGNQKEFDPLVQLQVIRKTVEGLELNKIRKSLFLKRIDNIIKLLEKGKIDKVNLRSENFAKILQKRIDRKDPKKIYKGRLTKADAEILLTMFEELLDNLNK